MKIEVITIGDELLAGHIVDTNFAWLGDWLWPRGFHLHWHTSVGDEPGDIAAALQQAAARSEAVIVTGGLGPTLDDITIETAAQAFGRPWVLFPEALEAIRNRFQKLGRDMPPNNEKQARLPEGTTLIPNDNGTAPGCYLETGGRHFFFLPGVPEEMKKMAEGFVFPRLLGLAPPQVYVQKSLRCFGMTESAIDRKLSDIDLTGIDLAFRIVFPEILLKISARGSGADLEERVARVEKAVRERLGDVVYSAGDMRLPEVVGAELVRRQATLAVAESCTGGFLASLITDCRGSSRYFLQGNVTYSNDAKRLELGVPASILEAHGAVSVETALAMADGLRQRSGSTYALSLTGIAGPDGGSEEKPVGTLYIALASPEGTTSRKLFFPSSREWFKKLAAYAALDLLRKSLVSGEPGRVAGRS